MMFILGYDPGAVHRWAALLRFDDKPHLVAVYEVPESREGAAAVIAKARAECDDGLVVAVERPKGVAHGDKLSGVKGKGANLLETMNAAERFACIAWSRGYRVVERSASEVRQVLCHDKSASDAMVRAVVSANVVGTVSEGAAHVQDAEAIALVEGARITGYRIVYPAALFKAKARRAQRAAVKKLGPSVAKAMREQGYR